MAEHSEHAVLNHLIEICRDSAQGFNLAADHILNPVVRSLFRELSDERGRFAAELLPHAQRLGGDAPSEGTTSGVVHRKWMEVKSALVGRDDAIVAEAKRGDHFAVQAFRDSIDGMLPPDARELVERQFAAVQRGHERVEALV